MLVVVLLVGVVVGGCLVVVGSFCFGSVVHEFYCFADQAHCHECSIHVIFGELDEDVFVAYF